MSDAERAAMAWDSLSYEQIVPKNFPLPLGNTQLNTIAFKACAWGYDTEHVWPNSVVLGLLGTLALLETERKVIDNKIGAIMSLGHGGENSDKCQAESGECSVCSVLDCQDNDAFHYHHDGCPSCVSREIENDGRRDARGEY